jgi:hypothetical protein
MSTTQSKLTNIQSQDSAFENPEKNAHYGNRRSQITNQTEILDASFK